MSFEELNFIEYPEGGNNCVRATVDFQSGWEMVVTRFAGAEGFELERYEIQTLCDGEPTMLKPITVKESAVRDWIKPHQITKYLGMMPEAIEKQ